MPQAIWSIYEDALCLIEVLLFYDFLNFMLKRDRQIKWKLYYLSIILLPILVYILTEINIYSIIRTTLLYIIMLFIAYVFFKGKTIEKLSYVTMFYFFLIFSDILTANVLTYFIHKDIRQIVIEQIWTRVLFSQISKILFFIILRLIKNNHIEREDDIPKPYWYWILLVYLISGLNLLIIFKIGLITNDLNINIEYLIIIIGLASMMMVIMTYYIFIKLSGLYNERSDYRIVEIKNEMLQKEIKEKERIYEDVKRFEHDFKNHIICLDSLIRQERFESANEYIGNLKDEVVEIYTWINTGNDALDAILNQKRSEGIKKDINMDMKINIPKGIGIKSLDLCTILGNVLDNGIEANEKIDDISKRNIELKINLYKEYLFIETSNPTLFNPIDEKGNLKTTKNNKKNHGFGMKSIESIVEEYNGILMYEYDKGKFVLDIMLPTNIKETVESK